MSVSPNDGMVERSWSERPIRPWTDEPVPLRLTRRGERCRVVLALVVLLGALAVVGQGSDARLPNLLHADVQQATSSTGRAVAPQAG